ncbi:uncharacterized protein LOC134238171 [Saccostrea cucullata]|uniref:uncharacterized protein LOC134238171 n=1 Tax=Saccostrea cuccullata TaxID=36930 RepID=UPI002ED00063
MEVLSLFPEESISGLEGAVDTDLSTTANKPGCSGKSASDTSSCSQIQGPLIESFEDTYEIIKHIRSQIFGIFLIHEVEIPTEACTSATLQSSDNDECTRQLMQGEERTGHGKSKGKALSKKKKCTEDVQMENLILIKRERVVAEKRKAAALERIATALEAKMKK